jgi:glycosyltransferase involved in cell wall biosynthesis
MRVCVLTTSFPLYRGITIGAHVLQQVRCLKELGVEVDVIAPHHPGAPRRELLNGISIYRFRYMFPQRWQTLCYGAGIPANLQKSFWAKAQLPFLLLMLLINTLIIARRSDIIHAHWSLSGLAGTIAGKLLHKPVVVMLHHGRASMRRDFAIKFVAKTANCILCNSQYTLSKLLQREKPKSAKVVSPGVDVERFHPQVDKKPFFSRERKIPSNRPLVLSLGRLIEWKGFQYLIDAMGMIESDPLPYLLIGGRGPLRNKLERQVRQKNLEDRIRIVDHIPFEFIHHYYRAADVFVLPSIIDKEGNTEGLGVVLLEALACGIPCIASRVGGITDIVQDGKNGFLVEPEDPAALAGKIAVLIEDDRLRKKMSEYGRRFVVNNFSWKAKAQEMYRIYQKLIESE